MLARPGAGVIMPIPTIESVLAPTANDLRRVIMRMAPTRISLRASTDLGFQSICYSEVILLTSFFVHTSEFKNNHSTASPISFLSPVGTW